MMNCDKDKIKDDKDNDEEEEYKDETEGESGSRKGKLYGVNVGIFIIEQGWMGEGEQVVEIGLEE